ncbi:glutathione S-transferase family protein [Zavarzinia sp. CC-PAN008]|uniref:glutathione S-transferase family protein n=1 Tax=Zavarzinia sp. CC-PAN008 TaxID=3243332 RepID=UPI003F745F29
MIELYHCTDARSFRPLWALEELGLPYQLHMLPFPPRVLAKPYLGINPLGTIPFLIDGDARMTESSAICHYLAMKYGPTPLAVAPEEPGFGNYLNYLVMGEATLTFPQTIVLRYTRLEPSERRIPQAAEDYAKWFLGRLRGIEARTGEAEYLVADRFTMADISVAYAILLAKNLKLDGEFGPNVRAYWDRVTAREGFARAKAAQAKASEEQGLEVKFG